MTQRVLVGRRFHLGRRGVRMDVLRRGLRSRAKVHSPEDPVAQKERPYEEKRQEPDPYRSCPIKLATLRARHQIRSPLAEAASLPSAALIGGCPRHARRK